MRTDDGYCQPIQGTVNFLLWLLTNHFKIGDAFSGLLYVWNTRFEDQILSLMPTIGRSIHHLQDLIRTLRAAATHHPFPDGVTRPSLIITNPITYGAIGEQRTTMQAKSWSDAAQIECQPALMYCLCTAQYLFSLSWNPGSHCLF